MSNTTINYTPSSRPTQTEANTTVKLSAHQPFNPTAANQTDKPVVKITTDQASLSAASGLINKGLSGSDVRTDKVASLQKAINAGTYHVSSAKVADKLLQSILQ